MRGGRNTTSAARTSPWTWPARPTSSSRVSEASDGLELWAPADLEPVTTPVPASAACRSSLSR